MKEHFFFFKKKTSRYLKGRRKDVIKVNLQAFCKVPAGQMKLLYDADAKKVCITFQLALVHVQHCQDSVIPPAPSPKKPYASHTCLLVFTARSNQLL